MALNTEQYNKRLDRVEHTLFPPGSVAFRIRNLSPYDQAALDKHRKQCAEWVKARPGEQAYADFLDGQVYPELPGRLASLLFPAWKDELSAEENYRNLLEAS